MDNVIAITKDDFDLYYSSFGHWRQSIEILSSGQKANCFWIKEGSGCGIGQIIIPYQPANQFIRFGNWVESSEEKMKL